MISRLVQNPDFEEKMKEKINMSIDTREADQSLENAYVKITELEDVVAQYQDEIESIRREKISADNVYNYLILFHDAYDQLPDIWKKKFFQSFIQEIQLYPKALENGQALKSMKFKFPVFYQGQTIEKIRWDKENTVEVCCLLEQLKSAKEHIEISIDAEDYYRIKDSEKKTEE